MENKLVQMFISQVNEVISVETDKDALFEALRKYQTSSDIKFLVQDLKRLINDPSRLEIYDFVKPLIRPQHQQHYDKMTPNAPGQRLRVIKLRRKGNESFGFAVRGGKEHGVGIFISHVQPGSQAETKGLKMGDEIVRVNGFTIAEAIHEEVLNLIKGRDEIELKVTSLGMVPIKQKPTDPVSWQYVEKSALSTNQTTGSSGKDDVVKIFINLRGATSLGCSIISGRKQFAGIFIETVKPGSLAEDYGLEVGDQIVEVNGRSFLDIKHKEALVEFKSSKELNMVIKKGAGLPLLNMKQNLSIGSGSPVQPRKDEVTRSAEESADAICEILEEDLNDKLEKQRFEQEQHRLHKLHAEEQVKQQQYLEHEQRRQQEIQEQRLYEQQLQQQQRFREEEQIREEERIREEEQLREEEERRLEKAEEEEKLREEERQRQEAADRDRRQLEDAHRNEQMLLKKQQSAVLAGRSGPSMRSSMKPTLLGVATASQASFGKNRKKIPKEIVITMEEGVPLDMDLEGGTDTPLGKLVVTEVFLNGAVDKNGEIARGDQILMVNKTSLENVTLTQAQEILWQAEQDTKPGESLKLTIIEGDRHQDDEITFF